jgi:hypothetical protein
MDLYKEQLLEYFEDAVVIDKSEDVSTTGEHPIYEMK